MIAVNAVHWRLNIESTTGKQNKTKTERKNSSAVRELYCRCGFPFGNIPFCSQSTVPYDIELVSVLQRAFLLLLLFCLLNFLYLCFSCGNCVRVLLLESGVRCFITRSKCDGAATSIVSSLYPSRVLSLSLLILCVGALDMIFMSSLIFSIIDLSDFCRLTIHFTPMEVDTRMSSLEFIRTEKCTFSHSRLSLSISHPLCVCNRTLRGMHIYRTHITPEWWWCCCWMCIAVQCTFYWHCVELFKLPVGFSPECRKILPIFFSIHEPPLRLVGLFGKNNKLTFLNISHGKRRKISSMREMELDSRKFA